MALEGTIKDFGLADIFQLIALQKKTGILTLESKGNTVNISFQEGMLVSADALRKWEGDRLGMVLVKAGKITKEELNKALEFQKGTIHRLGHILVKEGLITKEDLSQALERQMMRLIFNLFHWKDGTYRFIPKKVYFDDELLNPIDTEYILIEGIRIIDEWPSIEKRIPSIDKVFKRVNSEIHLSLSGEDKMILDLVDGESDIGMIIDSSGIGEIGTCKALIRLIDAGLIEETSLKMEVLSALRFQTRSLFSRFGPLVLYGAILILFIFIWGIKFIKETHNPLTAALGINRIEDLRAYIKLYYLDKGKYPSSLDLIVTERYRDKADTFDPWGREYIYRLIPEDGFELYSSGPDGRDGTEDDIR